MGAGGFLASGLCAETDTFLDTSAVDADNHRDLRGSVGQAQAGLTGVAASRKQDQDEPFMTIVEQALSLVADGQVVGLGTGRAATAFIVALAERVNAGLQIRGVPTSRATAELARASGIPLVTLADVDRLDIAFDGADEVSPQLDLVKGYGGALVREKIVAAASKQFVVLVGPEKCVAALGERGRLPIEVIPFGADFVRRQLSTWGIQARARLLDGAPMITDNGNWIFDLDVAAMAAPAELETRLRGVPGVVGTGLFLGMADAVFIQHAERMEIRRRGQPA
jgi:ribose 5-phosphate isomerase A